MKVLRFLAVTVVCVALVLFMTVHSFAVSRYNSHSYWISASGEVQLAGMMMPETMELTASTGLNPPSDISSEFHKDGYYTNNVVLASYFRTGGANGNYSGSYENPSASIMVYLGKQFSVPAGEFLEFYIQLKDSRFSNVTTGFETPLAVEALDYVVVTLTSPIADENVTAICKTSGDWIYVRSNTYDTERTISGFTISFWSPYVVYSSGDIVNYDLNLSLSDIVIGAESESGLETDVNPGQDQFEDDVIGGIDDANDKLDGIDSVIQDVNDAIHKEYPTITIDPDRDPEQVVDEGQAIEGANNLVDNALNWLSTESALGASSWIQTLFGHLMQWEVLIPFLAILPSLLIIRAVLGR